MDPSPIKIAALKLGETQKRLAAQAGIPIRRWYRLIEDLAVPTEEELARIAVVTNLPVDEVRRALTGTAQPREPHQGRHLGQPMRSYRV